MNKLIMNFSKILTILTVLLFFIFSPAKIYSQNYYEDSFTSLKDTVFYPAINSTLNSYKYDSVFCFAEDVFSYYIEQGQIDRATYLFNICCYYPLAIGMTDTVLPIIKEKLDYLRHNTDTNNVHFATLNQITSFGYKYNSDFEKAKPYIESAVKIYESVPTPLLHKSSAYYNYGGIVLSTNDYYGAYILYKKALEGFNANFDTISQNFDYFRKHDAATSYIGIAFGMNETGQLLLTEAFNKKAYNTLIEYPKSDLLAICETNLSSNYIDLEEYDKAIDFADSALSFVADQNIELFLNDVYITSLKNIGIAYLKKGNYQKSLASLKTAYNFLIDNLGDDNLRLASISSDIANVYYEINKTDSALAYFNIATQYSPNDPSANIEFAKALLKMNKYENAISILKNIFTDSVNNYVNKKYEIEKNTYLAKCYSKKYDISRKKQDLELSIMYAKTSNSLIINHLNNTILGNNDLKFANDFHDIAEIGIYASYKLYQITNNKEYLNEYIHFISQSTATKLNIEIGHLSNKSTNSSSNKQIDLLQDIRILENELQALSESKNHDLYEEVREQLTTLRIKAFELSYFLKETEKCPDKNLYSDYIDLKNVKKLLLPDEAIIQFFVSTDGIYSSIIRNNTTNIFFTKTNNITDLINNYNKSLKTGGNNFSTVANNLYRVLFDKLKSNLKGINKLIIIPDDMLNQIPMEPIVTNTKSGNMLINDFSIVYNYSLYIWNKNRSSINTNTTSFVGFAPIFSSQDNTNNVALYTPFVIGEYPILRSAENLAPLPFSGIEVDSISQLFNANGYSSDIFIGNEATEENFKTNISNKSIIHIATHGYSSITDPQLSCLYLFPKNDSLQKDYTNDGKIYLGEIFTMSPSANLVVLSTCKSGTGKIIKGEGVMALPRAFLFAGTPNIISSLWKIHDEKTMNLMLDFYKELIVGNSYANALRVAKLKQIKKGELTTNWGGIILIGE